MSYYSIMIVKHGAQTFVDSDNSGIAISEALEAYADDPDNAYIIFKCDEYDSDDPEYIVIHDVLYELKEIPQEPPGDHDDYDMMGFTNRH